nr:glycoside hydrolase family 3 C-terminal domain-containing protein [Sphingomonas melonis]
MDDGTAIAAAVQAARDADVAGVLVGERQEMDGEAASKASFDLPGRQQAMLDAVVATGKPVVVVLLNGRPVDLKDLRAAAILEMMYHGSAGSAATASLIFGDGFQAGSSCSPGLGGPRNHRCTTPT